MESETSYDSNYYSGNSQDRDRPALLFYDRLIRRHLPPGPCLDFGCGTGHLLKRISRHRPAIGVESSSWARPVASKNAPEARILSSLSDVEDGACAGLVSIHAVEHIEDQDLLPLFAEFHRIMKAGARALIVTPDAAGWAARRKGSGWIAFSDPTHINLKSHAQWAAMFERAGFRLVAEGADGLYDFPYTPRRHPKVDVLLRGWPTLFQFVLGRLVLEPGVGESSIFVLEACGSAAAKGRTMKLEHD